MMNDRIYELLRRQLEGELSEADRSELYSWMDQSNENRLIAEEFLNEDQLNEALQNVVSKKLVWQRVQEGIDEKVVPMQMRFVKWVAAACIILAVGVGALLWFNKRPSDSDQGDKTQVAKTNDVLAPTDARAVITLTDGSKIFLDSVRSGMLATQGGIKVVKLDNGQVAYQTADGEVLKEMQYNTLNNPRGSKVIDMQLSDGSHIWLNAGSSVTYPVAFIGNERKVEITGEAFFEVARSLTASGAKKSFVVDANGVRTEVLGTHFNVNAYEDEQSVKVTLFEGSVKVANSVGVVILKPGEQARATAKTKLQTINAVDLDGVMAWKNNLFIFSGDKIQTIMRQVARWYNVEVQYKGNITNEDFVGIVSRASNVSEVLKMMEATRKVKFVIEEDLSAGRVGKIVVTSP